MKNRSHRITLIALFLLFSLLLFGHGETVASITVDAASALQNSNLSAVRMYAYPEGKGDLQSGSYYLTRMNTEDLLRLRTETGLDFLPIYPNDLQFLDILNPEATVNTLGRSLYPPYGVFSVDINPYDGLVPLNEQDFSALGFRLDGRLPKEKDEIVITRYSFELYRLAGIRFADGSTVAEGMLTADTGENGLMGKEIAGRAYGTESAYRIVGIVDTGFDFDDPSYRFLRADYTGNIPSEHEIIRAQSKLADELQNGYHAMIFCTDALINELEEYTAPLDGRLQETYTVSLYPAEKTYPYPSTSYANYVLTNKHLSALSVFWLNGEKTSLDNSEIILSLDTLLPFRMKQLGFSTLSDIPESAPLPNCSITDLLLLATAPDYFGYEDTMTYEEYKAALFGFLNSHFGLSLTDSDWEGVIRAFREITLPRFLQDFGTLYSDVGSLALFVHAYENYDLILQNTEKIDELLSSHLFNNKTLADMEIPEAEMRGFLTAVATVAAEGTSDHPTHEDFYGRTVAEIVYGAMLDYLTVHTDEFTAPTVGALKEGDPSLTVVGYYIPQTSYEEKHILAPRYWHEPEETGIYSSAIAAIDLEKNPDAFEKLLALHQDKGGGHDLRIRYYPLRTVNRTNINNRVFAEMLFILGGIFAVCAAVNTARLFIKGKSKESTQTE